MHAPLNLKDSGFVLSFSREVAGNCNSTSHRCRTNEPGREAMRYAKNQKRSISVLLMVTTLVGCLCLLNRFVVTIEQSASAAPITFTVTETGDNGCANPLQRNCTLRQVIIAANNNPGLDTIRFAITGGPSAVKTISPLTELPTITDPVIIDATTQPGYAGQPLIELNGISAGDASGLTISTTAANSTVKGLIINRFARDGVHLMVGNGGNRIQNNYIGTDAAGSTSLGNGLFGIRVRSSDNVIGGLDSANRNVISGNAFGVLINGSAATDNTLQCNYIGTNAAGTARLGNLVGVTISGGAADNTIGGSSFGIGNVISGNNSSGIIIQDGSARNVVQGNFIGPDPTGTSALANAGNGLVISDAADTIVGGDADAERNVISGNGLSGILIFQSLNSEVRGNFIGTTGNGIAQLGNTFSGVEINTAGGNRFLDNTIAFNGRDGITILSGTANSFTNNRIFSNTGLAIDLGPDGVTPNDASDSDTGANNLQNFPVITSASHSGGNLRIRFTRDFAPAPSSYRFEFFANTSCDSSGNGEAESLILRADLLNLGGNGTFTVVSDSPLPAGRFITANVTRLLSPTDTSEFSPCFQLVTPGSLQLSAASYSVNESGGNATITINRVNGSDGPVSVNLTTSNGTATAGQDYTAVSQTINFANGETSRTVSIPITEDTSIEGNETINLTLSTPTGDAALGSPNTAVLTINDNDAGSFLHLGNTTYTGSEECAEVVVSVNRTGDTSGTSTVNYSTSSGTASDRADFSAALGTLRFNPGDTQKSFVVLLNEDSLTEGTETASITLSNPTNGSLGSPSIATLSIVDDSSEPATNANDDSAKFVCQHYHDFLNRQPDSAGQAFWTNEIESCGTNAQCREVKRINVSAAFFLSIEFQQTGYLVYRMYKAAYGNLPGTPVPLTLPEFLPDTQRIGLGVQVGIGDWQVLLEANKQALANEFVARTRFTSAYPAGMTAAQFVDTLNTNSGGALSTAERNQLVIELTAGTKTRAQVLRAVAEDQTFAQAEFNRAFVLMQYFGYLRRNPNGAPDSDFGGYNFWLAKLNEFGGNFVSAEMVKAFLVSSEYRQRFGP